MLKPASTFDVLDIESKKKKNVGRKVGKEGRGKRRNVREGEISTLISFNSANQPAHTTQATSRNGRCTCACDQLNCLWTLAVVVINHSGRKRFLCEKLQFNTADNCGAPFPPNDQLSLLIVCLAKTDTSGVLVSTC